MTCCSVETKIEADIKNGRGHAWFIAAGKQHYSFNRRHI